MYFLDYFGGVFILISGIFFWIRDKVIEGEWKTFFGGGLFELDFGGWK